MSGGTLFLKWVGISNHMMYLLLRIGRRGMWGVEICVTDRRR